MSERTNAWSAEEQYGLIWSLVTLTLLAGGDDPSRGRWGAVHGWAWL